jgi:hypothetical protein
LYFGPDFAMSDAPLRDAPSHHPARREAGAEKEENSGEQPHAPGKLSLM